MDVVYTFQKPSCMYVWHALLIGIVSTTYIHRLASDSPGLVRGQLAHCEVLHGGQLLRYAENQGRSARRSLRSQSVALGQPERWVRMYVCMYVWDAYYQ